MNDESGAERFDSIWLVCPRASALLATVLSGIRTLAII